MKQVMELSRHPQVWNQFALHLLKIAIQILCLASEVFTDMVGCGLSTPQSRVYPFARQWVEQASGVSHKQDVAIQYW